MAKKDTITLIKELEKKQKAENRHLTKTGLGMDGVNVTVDKHKRKTGARKTFDKKVFHTCSSCVSTRVSMG